MKTAFVHDRLFHRGGAEQLFFAHIENSHTTTGRIFTLFSDQETVEIAGDTYQVVVALPRWINTIFVRASRNQPPVLGSLFDYRNLIVIAPLLTWLLRQKILGWRPEHIYISSFAAVKNIVSPRQQTRFFKVTLYLHSPMQYIRENYTEYRQKMSRRQRLIFVPVSRLLRRRDSKPRLYDTVYANSEYTAWCARRYYHLKATVDYPPLEEVFHHVTPITKPHDYYLYVGRLVTFVRETDLIIRLFNQLELPLLVMGTGPDAHVLKQLAGPTIVFLGQVDDPDEKKTIIQQAKGLINLAKESCGIATMEALACGVPVFGYNQGATPELVGPDQGLLTDTKELTALRSKMKEFQEQTFDRKQVQARFWNQYNAHHHKSK